MSRFCTSCGHQLGIGRYCTNCGARIVETSDPASTTTASARYPLYADTVQAPTVEPTPTPAPAPAPTPSYQPAETAPEPRRSMLPWLFVVLAVLTVVAVTAAALLVLAPSGDDKADDKASDRTDRPGNGPPPGDEAPGPGAALAPADVDVPATAPPSVDGAGQRVTFTATNMLDADPTTSWRMAGDGTGSVLTFAFDDPVTVTEVGLVNGYAKIDPPHDWYAGNRRITEVVWVFDDGTEVAQELDDKRALQTTSVDPVQTTKVELRLVEVTAPGTGPDARDYTAISDVKFSGS